MMKNSRKVNNVVWMAILMLLMLSLAGPVQAADAYWTNGGGTGRWDLADNWSINAVPTSADLVYINDQAALGICLIDATTTAQSAALRINGVSGTTPLPGGQSSTAPGYLKMTGGTLAIPRLLVGDVGGMTGPARFEVTGGTVSITGTANPTSIGNAAGSQGRVDISGGATMTITAQSLNVGNNGIGKLYISNANTSVTVNKTLIVGNANGSDGYVEINGGTLETQTDLITFGHNGAGVLVMNGGTLKSGSHIYLCRNASTASASWTIHNGTVQAANNLYVVARTDTTVTMNNGTMILGGELRLNEAISGTTASFYLNGGTLQSTGRFVLPAGGTHTGWGKLFIWGGQAICGNQLVIGANSAKTGQVDIRHPGVLKVNANNNTLNSIRDYIKDGFITASSTSGRAYLEMTEDTVNQQIIVQAYNLSLAQAYDPDPISGALVDPTGRKLKWKAGDGAVSHRVYLSTNIADVQVPVGGGSYVTVSTTEYTPTLQLGKTYYWRIDEVASGGAVTQGAIWKFTTWDFITVENFESYANDSAIQAVWGAAATVYEKVGNSLPLFDTTSTRAMKLTMPATVVRTFSSAQDWSGYDAVAMVLHGMPDTVTSSPSFSLYVKLTDSSNASATAQFVSATFPRYAASQLVQEPEHLWLQWNVALSKFTGVNLGAVQKIEIGTLNASGPLYVDDIRLYSKRPIAWEGDGDINNDEDVDLLDFVSLAKDWLRATAVVTPAAPTVAPVVEYDFNDDPVMYGNKWYSPGQLWNDDYAMNASSLLAWSENAGRGGSGCLVLNGSTYAQLNNPEFIFSNVSTAVSISVWAKGDPTPIPDVASFGHPLFVGLPKNAPSGMHALSCYVPNERAQVVFLSGNATQQESVVWSNSRAADFEDSWRHWVFIKDIASGEFKVFCDGQLVARRNMAGIPFPVIDRFRVGMSPTGVTKYYGYIDDFKLYNYALTNAQVLYLAGKTTPTTVNLISQADLNGDGVVNTADLVRFAQDWIKQPLLWP